MEMFLYEKAEDLHHVFGCYAHTGERRKEGNIFPKLAGKMLPSAKPGSNIE